MGLDTSHDCWHGPYSQFMRWRQRLHYYIHIGQESADGMPKVNGWAPGLLERAWNEGWYADQSVPINVLMQHSDCDGEIAAAMCGPIADALEKLLERMPERGIYDEHRPATERFIAGLRRAAANNEPVLFR